MLALARRRGAEITAFFAAVALYWPTLGYGFVFDDAALIGADGWPVPLGGLLLYRPLRYASYLVDGSLGGSAAVYHAHNLVLHGVIAAMVAALARRLGSTSLAALLAALWVAWHPLGVEVAAYVAGRRDLLCVALGLAALLAQLASRPLAALGLLLLSVGAKESGLVFAAPLAVAAVLGVSSGRRSFGKRLLAGLAVGAAATLGLALAWLYGAIGPWGPVSSAAGLALPGRMAVHYSAGLSGLSVFAPEYPQLLHYVDRVRGGDWPAMLLGWLGSSALAAAVGFALWRCRRAERAGAGREQAMVLAWLTLVLVAVCCWGGLHEPGADRHGFLLLPPAGLGLALLLTRLQTRTMVFRVGEARAWLRVGAAVPLLGVLAGEAMATRLQMQVWRSEQTLWTFAASLPGPSDRALGNAARAAAMSGSYEVALGHLAMASRLAPQGPSLHLARAAVRCATGREWLARRDLRRAVRYGAAPTVVSEIAATCTQSGTAARRDPPRDRGELLGSEAMKRKGDPR